MQKIGKVIKKIKRAIGFLLNVYRRGGYASVQILNVNYGKILLGKKILITGGSSGIGLCIAKKCLNEGAHVVITGRDEVKLNKVKDDINNQFLKTLVWDVSKISEMDNRLNEVRSFLDSEIDILVNNAAVMSSEPFGDVSEGIWDEIYAVNSKAVFFLSQAVVKKWEAQSKRGLKKIINISSQGGFVGATYPYRMTKWDIAGLTKGLGLALAPKGIIVNGIAPGIVATNMQAGYLKDKGNLYTTLNPLERVSMPEEIAELAIFLMSDAGNYIVGQTILCDGGYALK
jgi:3-oxoacyl-[acyl-carrier protein] reductase